MSQHGEPDPDLLRVGREPANHLRTVDTGNPNLHAARRCPTPIALAANAAPITSASSRRRSRVSVLISTWVLAHRSHRERRGRCRTSPPPRSRSTRHRADPHGRSRPPQPGHSSSPATSARSTSTPSVPTIFNSASGHQEGPSRHRQVKTGRVLACALRRFSYTHSDRFRTPVPGFPYTRG